MTRPAVRNRCQVLTHFNDSSLDNVIVKVLWCLRDILAVGEPVGGSQIPDPTVAERPSLGLEVRDDIDT
jgi:hypothetical protein